MAQIGPDGVQKMGQSDRINHEGIGDCSQMAFQVRGITGINQFWSTNLNFMFTSFLLSNFCAETLRCMLQKLQRSLCCNAGFTVVSLEKTFMSQRDLDWIMNLIESEPYLN